MGEIKASFSCPNCKKQIEIDIISGDIFRIWITCGCGEEIMLMPKQE